jgi:hypothetical protein
MIASRLYQAKGTVIRKNPAKYLKKRADVSLSGKIYHTLRGLAAFTNLSPKRQEHDAALHVDLKSLPAVHAS